MNKSIEVMVTVRVDDRGNWYASGCGGPDSISVFDFGNCPNAYRYVRATIALPDVPIVDGENVPTGPGYDRGEDE